MTPEENTEHPNGNEHKGSDGEPNARPAHPEVTVPERDVLQVKAQRSDGGETGYAYRFQNVWRMFVGLPLTAIILAVAAVVQAFVSFIQWGALRDANNIARISADAATKSANIAEQALKLVQRADISAMPPVSISALAKPFLVQITFTNDGQTTATDFHSFGKMVFLKQGEQRKIDYEDAGQSSNQGKSVSVPAHRNVSISFYEPDGINPSNLDVVNSGNAQIILYGKATYNDLFSVAHYTHFCATYQLNAAGNTPFQGTPCSEWTDSN